MQRSELDDEHDIEEESERVEMPKKVNEGTKRYTTIGSM